MPALPPALTSPAARGAIPRDEVDVLITVLHGEQVSIGVTEAIRIQHVLSLGPEVDQAGLVQLVACLVARSPEQREAVERAVRLWFRSEEPKVAREVGLQQVFQPPAAAPAPRHDPAAAPLDEAPPSRRSPPEEPVLNAPAPARREVLLALLRTSRGLAALGATGGAVVVGGLLLALLLRTVPAGAEGLAGRLIALIVGGGVAVGLGLTTRGTRGLPPPGATSCHQDDLDLPPPPFHLRGPVLLDAREQREVVDGLGTHVTELVTPDLDVAATIRASAQAAGLPILIPRTSREVRTVWLWIDESACGGLLSRTAFEIQALLRAGGIPVEVALLPAVPSPSGLYRASFSEDGRIRGPHPRIAPGEMGEDPEAVVVAILTDGRELSISARGARANEAARGLSALRRFPRLAFFDFGRERTSLPYLAERHRLLCLPPEELPAFLAGDGVQGTTLVEPEARLYGNERVWAAACALSPRPVDPETALALRSALDLRVESWRLQRILASSSLPGCVAYGSGDRARLLQWLCTSEVGGDGREDPPDRPASTLGRARAFWREQHAENRIDRALLDLWEMPGGEGDRLAKAVDVLHEWSKTRPGRRGCAEVQQHAPRPEGNAPIADRGGKILLPWRWSELEEYPEIRMRLAVLGLGRIAEAPPKERWRLPGSVAVSLGLAAGVAGGALATITGSAAAVLLAAGAVPAAVFLGIRWWQERTEQGLAPYPDAGEAREAPLDTAQGDEPVSASSRPAEDEGAVPGQALHRTEATPDLDPGEDAAREGQEDEKIPASGRASERRSAREAAVAEPAGDDLAVEPERGQFVTLFDETPEGAPEALRGAALAKVLDRAVRAEPPSPPSPPTPGPVQVDLPIDMVEFPGGTFWMGSRDDGLLAHDEEKPRHEVEVGAFAIGRYPVTQAQYAAVMGMSPGEPAGDALPVNNVSWQDAVRFCNRLSERDGLRPAYTLREGKESLNVTWDRKADGYRLPTEAEWEYAARGGTDTAWSFGDDEPRLGEHAWYGKNSGGQIQPVGRKKPNPNGLHDVHGNVWEWCWDWFGSYVISPNQRVNPVGPPAGVERVLRGGSWLNEPKGLRSACRRRDWPTLRLSYVGFRCARAVPRQHVR